MHVIVAGGRDRRLTLPGVSRLDALRWEYGLTTLWHGACPWRPSVDWDAERWATGAGLGVHRRPADWSLGPRAGPCRNRHMLRDVAQCGGAAFVVIGFQGGPGTADLLRQAGQTGAVVVDLRAEPSLTTRSSRPISDVRDRTAEAVLRMALRSWVQHPLTPLTADERARITARLDDPGRPPLTPRERAWLGPRFLPWAERSLSPRPLATVRAQLSPVDPGTA